MLQQMPAAHHLSFAAAAAAAVAPTTHPCLLCACVACSAVLAHIFLKEQLNIFGILGCVLCITGSITIVLHVPAEQPIESVAQVWQLAMQPGEQQAAATAALGGLSAVPVVAYAC